MKALISVEMGRIQSYVVFGTDPTFINRDTGSIGYSRYFNK